MGCSYIFKGKDGEEITLIGIPALKAYLADGGLEQFFPDKTFPWGAENNSAPEAPNTDAVVEKTPAISQARSKSGELGAAKTPKKAKGAAKSVNSKALFSNGNPGDVSGKTVADFQPIADQYNDNLKGDRKIVVVQSANEIQSDAEPLFQSGVRVEGAYIGGKKAYIVADSIKNEQRFREVAEHELHHMAAEETIASEEYARAIKNIIRMDGEGNKVVRELAAEVDARQPGLDAETRAKEIMAMAVETGKYKQSPRIERMFAEIVAAFKRIARKLGADAKMFSDMGIEEVFSLLRRGQSDLYRGGGKYAPAETVEPVYSKNPFEGSEVAKTPLPEGTTTIEVNGVQRPALNSNGKPIHPTVEGARNFWRWFGDSKVVDAEGRPLVVYHGTDKDFSAFDNKKLGVSTGAKSAKLGHYFTDRIDVAESYANYAALDAPVKRALDDADMAEAKGDWDAYDEHVVRAENLEAEIADEIRRGQNIVPAYLRISKADEMDAKGEMFSALDGAITKRIQTAVRAKKDGVIIRNLDDSVGHVDRVADHFVVFTPEQIKSATGNTGEFSASNPDIRYSVSTDGKTVAEFGPVTTEFKDDPEGAIKYLMENKTGEAIVNNPALGEISLVYGNDNMGLKHIVERRGEEFLNNLPKLLESAKVYEKDGQTKRVFIGNDSHEATIRLDWDGKAKTWLLSAYEKYPDLSATEQAPVSHRSKVVESRTGMSADDLKQVLVNGRMGDVIAKLIDSGVVVLHNSTSTMPKMARGVKGVQAVTMPDGKIHMVAANLRADNALAVLAHEFFQAGGRDLLGSTEWSKLMGRGASLYRQAELSTGRARQFFDRARARVASAKQKGAVNTKNEVEEFLAYAIEEYKSSPDNVPAAIRKWVEDVIGHVKAWVLKNFGTQLGNVTPDQLAAISRMAMREAQVKQEEKSSPSSLPKFSARNILEEQHNIDLAAQVLLDLSEEEGMFSFKTSKSNTLEGVFADTFPDAEYLGETTREDERSESTADHRYTFKMPSGHTFYVYTTDDGKVWIDVSRLTTGEGGQQVYWAVANYAYNNHEKFVADPYGLSTDSMFRRTANMLATAIRFGTTRHIEPGEQQIFGNLDEGVEPLEWSGSDFDKIKSLVHTHVASVINNFPALEKYRYDFTTQQFVGPDGRPVSRAGFDHVGGAGVSRRSRAGGKTLRRAVFLRSLLSATADAEPGIIESSYRRSNSIVKGSGPLFSVSPDEREAVLEEADRAIDAPAPRDDFIGGVIGDISLASKLINHPRQVAAIHKEFTPVYRTGISQIEARDRNIADLGADVKAYDHLSQAEMENVNKLLELGRLTATVYTPEELSKGVTNTGDKTIVKMVDGKPQLAKAKIQALLTEPGEVVTLNENEIKAYQDLRKMFDRALDKMRDQTLTDLGFEQFVGEKNAAKAIMDSITKDTTENQAEKLRNVANFVSEIEQAKRAGYVPFARYGDYVVTVKEKIADVKFSKDGDDHLIAKGLPESFAQDMLDMGAEKTGQGWKIKAGQRKDVEKLADKTIYSAKVELGLGDKLPEMSAKRAGSRGDEERAKAKNIPAVAKAIEKAESEWVDGHSNRRIVAIPVRQKTSEQAVKLSDVDALAEVANIDTETWDLVRDKLSDAIKSKSFRSHFFHSDDVPGYTGDFERSIADYVIGMSGYLARREHAKQWENTVSAIKDKPKLFEYASKYRDYVNNPQEEFAMVRQIGFFAYIAGVMATAYANLTQVPFLSYPVLKQVAPAHLVIREISRAYKDAAKMISAKAGMDMFDPDKAPEDVRAMLKEAWADGSFVPLESFDLMMTARQRNVGARKGVKAFNTTTQVASLAFTFAERMNRLVTFIAAARLAEKSAIKEKAGKVLKGDALAQSEVLNNWNPKSFAEWVVDESQFRMGKANRPEMMRGVGAPVMQFKGFMIQTMEAWYRMAALHGKDGKFAALASLGALYTFAGLWGLPGADDLRKLIENIYKQITDKDLDIKTELRAWIAQKSGSQALAVMANKGIPYIYGVDLTRVGMGSIAPESPLAAAGIPFDMVVGRPKRAFEKYSSGDSIGAASEFTPNFIKHWLVAGDWAIEGVRDKQGNRILLPSDLSNSDLAMKSMGFMPSIVTDVRDYEYAQRRMETSVDMLKRKYINQLAKAMVQSQNPDEKTAQQANDRIAELYQEIDEHNSTANPEQIIKIDNKALRNKIMREEEGVKQTWGRERKQSRQASEELRKVFGLSKEDDQ